VLPHRRWAAALGTIAARSSPSTRRGAWRAAATPALKGLPALACRLFYGPGRQLVAGLAACQAPAEAGAVAGIGLIVSGRAVPW